MNSPVTPQAPVGLPSPSRRPSLPGPAGARTVQAAFAFGLAALNLRIAVASLSPVLTEVQRDEHLSSFGGGALSTVPVVCFGAFAFLAPRLTRRFGPTACCGARCSRWRAASCCARCRESSPCSAAP
ncbi:hypothetical protein [Streptomyces sp. CLI2509]|uniref:hypothetical protein n=1 Tax=Streptomyces sp. CLI2509 TaxID=1984801 RepID=UPI001F259564|nr:hypothetical protein [Streptomyces sp. CLI2509]